MEAQDETTRKRLKHKLLTELGPLIGDALADDRVTEVQLNPDGRLWTDGVAGNTEIGRMYPTMARNLANTFAACVGSIVNYNSPMLEGDLSLLNGERLTVLTPPLVRAASFALRKHTSSRMSLDDWGAAGGMTPDQKDALVAALRDRRNVIISGGTGSGKTTFVNAMLAELAGISPGDRIVLIEDTRELQVEMPNVIAMTTSETVDMSQLLRKALRLTPHRIVVGEVRGAEALTMLESWNTGHPGGLSTIHASSAHKARTRLEQMCAAVPNRGAEQIKAAVDAALDMVVQIERCRDGTRRVVDIHQW